MKRFGIAGLLLCVAVLVSKLFAHPTANELVFSDTNGENLTAAHSGMIITNPAATGSQTFELPAAAAGIRFIFALSAAQKIKVNPDDNDQFIGNGLSTSAGDALESDQVVGTLIEFVAIDSTKWLQIRKVGTWTDMD
jgi:hypothetical protein